MAANKKQFSVENRVTFYRCRQGHSDHYVREDQVIIRESDSKKLCPIHLKPLWSTPIEGILEQGEPLHQENINMRFSLAMLAATS